MRRASGFGRYEGFSEPRFDGYRRVSRYLPARDGVRLAIDYFLPTTGGSPSSEPLPVVLQMTPYDRAQVVHGELIHVLSPYRADGRSWPNNLAELSRHGYVVAAFDVRGQGASFGAFTGCMTAEEGRDAADVIAWLVAQPWCSGKIGMLGSSYGGQTQFLAASEKPPGLSALFPCHSLFDAYDVFFPGGVRQLVLPRAWAPMVDSLAGRTGPSVAAPVDGPDGPALLAEAIAEHRRTRGAAEVFEEIYARPTRDGTGYFVRASASGSQNLSTLLPRLRETGIPAYHWGGWNDYYPGQAVLWFLNWAWAPAKLALGPWTHSPRTFTSPRDVEDVRLRAIESLRWFDFWLKGIDNGVLDEPRVHYAIQASHRFREGDFEVGPDRWEWEPSRGWPLDDVRETRLWLAPGPSGSVASVNDGRLTSVCPARDEKVECVVDDSVGTGALTRLGASLVAQPVRYPEMSGLDARVLTWTTEPFEDDLVVAGTPVVELFATSTAPDAVFVVWLEDVDARGRSTPVSYGSLKASHRELGGAPYATGEMLWHPSTEAVVESTPGLNACVARIALSFLPVANRFVRGHRLRLTLAFADGDNLEAVCVGSTVRVLLGPTFPSALVLPVRPSGRRDGA